MVHSATHRRLTGWAVVAVTATVAPARRVCRATVSRQCQKPLFRVFTKLLRGDCLQRRGCLAHRSLAPFRRRHLPHAHTKPSWEPACRRRRGDAGSVPVSEKDGGYCTLSAQKRTERVGRGGRQDHHLLVVLSNSTTLVQAEKCSPFLVLLSYQF